DPVTLQLKRPAQSKAESYWDGEGWKKAARWYHENQQGRTLIVETDPEQIKRLRQLLTDDVTLDRALRELNAQENRPTPSHYRSHLARRGRTRARYAQRAHNTRAARAV